MATVIFFMPYDPKHPKHQAAHVEYGAKGSITDSGSIGGKFKNLNSIHDQALKGNIAGEIWWDGSGHSTQLQARYAADTQIMIRGHGMAGWDTIEGGRGGERISWKDAANRLFCSGLNTNFMGSITCYCCHSAEATDETGSQISNGNPFAQNFANYMYHTLGYKNCRFFGYLGSIDSFAQVKDWKNTKDLDKDLYSRAKGGFELLGTAKQATVQFHPKTLTV